MEPRTDIELVRDAQAGSRDAFSELCSRYFPYIKKCCWMVVGEDALANDMTQETFLKMLNNIHLFNTELENANFKAYLRIAAVNICKKYIKHFSLEQEYVLAAMEKGNIALRHSHNPEAEMIKDERDSIFRKAISQLPDIMRKCIEAFYYWDLTVKEIADLLELQQHQVYHQLKIGRKILAKKLGEYGPKLKRNE